MIKMIALGLMIVVALAALCGWWRFENAVLADDTGTPVEGRKVVVDPCCAPAKAGTTDALSRATRMPPGAEKGASAAAIACSLTDAGQRKRLNEIRALLAKSATRIERSDREVVVAFSEGHAAEVVSFIELERACCPFLSFELAFPSGKPTTLRVTAPEGGESMLEALFAAGDSSEGKSSADSAVSENTLIGDGNR